MIILKSVVDDGYNFFTGVPDSGLKSFIKEIQKSEFEHIPATNEGQAIGIAVGAELAGMKSCVYLCIPHNIHPLLVIGHRHTLPQHTVMGRVDKKMLELIGYENYIIVEGDNNVK